MCLNAVFQYDQTTLVFKFNDVFNGAKLPACDTINERVKRHVFSVTFLAADVFNCPLVPLEIIFVSFYVNTLSYVHDV